MVVALSDLRIRRTEMSEMGQSRRFGHRPTTSGATRLADIRRAGWHVSMVPEGDMPASPAQVLKADMLGAANDLRAVEGCLPLRNRACGSARLCGGSRLRCSALT
jgi:hypothetical protein